MTELGQQENIDDLFFEDVTNESYQVNPDDSDKNVLSDQFIKEFQNNSLIKEALLSGIDMREYRTKVAEELEMETQMALEAFIAQEDTYLELEHKIDACDKQLEYVETVLSQFRTSINEVSSEIVDLREESLVMNLKLENYQKVFQELQGFSSGIAIDNAYVQFITSSKPTDEKSNYLDCLLSLEEKMSIAERYGIYSNNILSLKEVSPQFEAMKNNACQKIVKFFLDKFQKIKQSKANIQEITSELRKYQYYYYFLDKYSIQGAKEVQQSYIAIMSKYYRTIFKNYISSLQKRVEKSDLTKYHTIVEKKGKFLTGGPNIRKSLQIGSKINLLNQPVSSTISVANLDKNEKISFEAFFRSVNILLITLGKREYIFCKDFFGDKETFHSTGDETLLNSSSVSLDPGLGGEYTKQLMIERIFKSVFEKSQNLILELLTQYLKTSFDAVGMLLIIRILQQLMESLHSAQIQSLDSFYDGVLMNLWMKFKEILGEHQMSLKTAPIEKLYLNERDTHTIAKRYAAIVSAIQVLSQGETADSQMIDMSIGMLRNVFTSFIDAVSGRLSSPLESMAFLINTYDVVIGEFYAHNLDVVDCQFFKQLHEKRTDDFIRVKLQDSFGPLIEFVNKSEPKIVDTNDKQTIDRNLQSVDANQMEALAREFHSNWRNRVTHEQQEIQKQFKSLDTAMKIFKEYLTQLISYYKRFQQIIARCFRNPPFKAMIVSGQSIMQFVKQLG